MRSRGVRLSLLLHPLNRCRIHGPTANPVARGRSPPSKRRTHPWHLGGYVGSYGSFYLFEGLGRNSHTQPKPTRRAIFELDQPIRRLYTLRYLE